MASPKHIAKASDEPGSSDSDDLQRIRLLVDELYLEVHDESFQGSERYLAGVNSLYRQVRGIRDEIISKIDCIHEVVQRGEIPLAKEFRKKTESVVAQLKGQLKKELQVKGNTLYYRENGTMQDSSEDDPRRYPLHAAAERGDRNKMENLLQSGHKVNEPGIFEESALSCAVNQCNIDSIQFLLTAGADVNYRSLDGENEMVLNQLCKCKEEAACHQIFRYILSHGAKLDVCNKRQRTALMSFCHSAWLSNDIVQLMLDGGASLDCQDEYGNTVLHHLTRYSSTDVDGSIIEEVAETLVERGASVFIANAEKHTPLWYAVSKGRIGCAEYLLGVINSSSPIDETPADFKDSSIVEMLNASANNCLPITEILLDAVKDRQLPFANDLYRGITPCESQIDLLDATVDGVLLLHYVTSRQYNQLVSGLLTHYPQLASVKDSSGEISLFTAVRVRTVHTIYAYLDISDPEITPHIKLEERNNRGESCFDLAQEIGSPDILAALSTKKPPESMTRGTWLRSWYDNERNIIKLCHDHDLAQGPEADYTFAPLEVLAEEEYNNRMLDSGRYMINYKNRGTAVILYNVEFDDPLQSEREGTVLDMLRLSRLFYTVNFNIVLWKNLTAAETKDRIKDLARRIGKSDQAFVFIMMSHGGKGKVFGVDSEPVYLDEDVITAFDGNHCPQLAGKPKVFLIQACRGRDHIAVRDKKHGSWFIEEFVLTFELYSHIDHLQSIVQKATKLLSKRLSYESGGVQVTETRTSLRKDLYLHRTKDDDTLAFLIHSMKSLLWKKWEGIQVKSNGHFPQRCTMSTRL